MANGEFATDIHDLDVTCASFGPGTRENWCYFDKQGIARAHIDEGWYIVGEDNRVPGVGLYYLYWVGGSSARCYAMDGNDEEFANRVCKNLSGLSEPSYRVNWANIYKLW